jgi:hypothetical protein
LKGSSRILHFNEASSREVVFKPAEEKKSDVRYPGCGAHGGLLEYELRHLLQIGLGIVEPGIVHLEHSKWYHICSPSCLKHGCERDDYFFINVNSIQ